MRIKTFHKPFRLGLTGSIGMGKSTTAQIFRDLGYPVYDADAEVHKLYASGGEGAKLIHAVFPDAINDDGAVDRKILSTHIQADPLNLVVLESFIHPMLETARDEFFKANSHHDILIYDIPILYETGGERDVDAVVVVTAPDDVQRKRVMAREGMTQDLFESLLVRQLPDSEKRKRADFLIFTDKGLDFAREQVQSIIHKIKTQIING